MKLAIRLLRDYRGRVAGQIECGLDFGVAKEWVRRGIAEPVVETSQPAAADRPPHSKPKRHR